MKNENSTTSISDIRHRLVLPVQTRGNLGKSTEAIARCEWMRQRKVAWQGYDLDVDNRTLSTAYPDEVVLIEPSQEPVGDVIRILRKVAQTEVTVLDPRAHMKQMILDAFRMVKFTEFAAKGGVRATVLVYPLDEISDMDDISLTVQTLGDSVDWVVVRNRARTPTTRFFDRSELEKRLIDLGGAFLEMPVLLTDTRNHIRAQEVKLGRPLSLGEAMKNPALEIDLVHRIILEQWLTDLFQRFDAIAGHLLPTQPAREIKPATLPAPAPATRRGAMINTGASL